MPNLMSDAVMLVLANVPDAATADAIEQALLAERLAACVNRLPPVDSRYLWQGRIEVSREIPLLIKTTAARLAELERRIAALHPYDVPEILAFHADHALAAYGRWVADCCAPPPPRA